GREARLVARAHLRPVEPGDARNERDGPLDGVDDEARDAVFDDLGNRTVPPGEYRRAAGHGLYHGKAEGLGPVDRKEKRGGVTEKRRFVAFAKLAIELHAAADEGCDAFTIVAL